MSSKQQRNAQILPKFVRVRQRQEITIRQIKTGQKPEVLYLPF